MGHCIQVIVAPNDTANSIANHWPELPRLDRKLGYAIFPISAELIDEKIIPDETPLTAGNEFKLLTSGFRKMLRFLSVGGQLAYIETDYFGGIGSQGAIVCRDGEEVLNTPFGKSGKINMALKSIGIRRWILADQFTVIGFSKVRSNDCLLDLIEAQHRVAK